MLKIIYRVYNSKIMTPFRIMVQKIRGTQPFSKPLFFLNNQKGVETACFILAGYKNYTWEIVFNRIKKFCPDNIDICIVSSGVYSEKLKNIATSNNWSYISMKRNCVTHALNSAIILFPFAKKIFKIDEDIFITDGFFENLPHIYEKSKNDYFPAFSAPLIPINGYGYRKILEKLNLVSLYSKKFEYPRISAGGHMQIENNPDVAKFFWGGDEEKTISQLDVLNNRLKTCGAEKEYSICPIRFSIGAIYFERQLLENFGFFPVRKGTCMGLDEEFLCNLATTYSKVIVVSERQVVGHLSFGSQNFDMKKYFFENNDLFVFKD